MSHQKDREEAWIEVETVRESTALVTLNRPAERNPLDVATLHELYDAIIRLTANGDIDAIVITGADPAFSAGGDLKGYQRMFKDPSEFSAFMKEFFALCDLLETSEKLTVAMVNGVCVAGGLELALACDVITISSEAMIGDGHLKFGQIPGAGSSQRLVRAIGVQRAKYWLLSARLFSAEEAVAAGLAIEVAPPGELLSRTLEIVREMTTHSRLGRRRMKELIRQAVDLPQTDGLLREMDIALDYASNSHDALEGLQAFAERRQPEFRGY